MRCTTCGSNVSIILDFAGHRGVHYLAAACIELRHIRCRKGQVSDCVEGFCSQRRRACEFIMPKPFKG
jgi:hypothetical protein